MKKSLSKVSVSHSEIVLQLAAMQAANAALEIKLAEAEAKAKASASNAERVPLSGSFKTTATGNLLTLTFVCNTPNVVASKNKSLKQLTQALYSQPRGGVGTIFDPASEQALLKAYGKTDVRIIGSIGIR